MRTALALALLAALALGLASCGDGEEAAGGTPTAPGEAAGGTPTAGEEGDTGPAGPETPPPVSATPTTTASGLQIIEIEVGDGAEAQAGATVSVHYTGWLTDGSKFDSSLDRGRPYGFILGAGDVIPGLDEGVAGMKENGRRRLIIPPELAYGAEGSGDIIPPDATLIFDVELLEVQ